MQRNRVLIAVALAIGLIGLGLFSLGRDGGSSNSSSPPPPTGTAVPITLPARVNAEPADTNIPASLPAGCEPLGQHDTIALSAVPPEVYDTLAVINDGPPYPYRADGGVFQNREGHLPDRERGYYLEFTVETPGSDDRGARRLVTGECGEFWYTDDHYDSFSLLDIEG